MKPINQRWALAWRQWQVTGPLGPFRCGFWAAVVAGFPVFRCVLLCFDLWKVTSLWPQGRKQANDSPFGFQAHAERRLSAFFSDMFAGLRNPGCGQPVCLLCLLFRSRLLHVIPLWLSNGLPPVDPILVPPVHAGLGHFHSSAGFASCRHQLYHTPRTACLCPIIEFINSDVECD